LFILNQNWYKAMATKEDLLTELAKIPEVISAETIPPIPEVGEDGLGFMCIFPFMTNEIKAAIYLTKVNYENADNYPTFIEHMQKQIAVRKREVEDIIKSNQVKAQQ